MDEIMIHNNFPRFPQGHIIGTYVQFTKYRQQTDGTAVLVVKYKHYTYSDSPLSLSLFH